MLQKLIMLQDTWTLEQSCQSNQHCIKYVRIQVFTYKDRIIFLHSRILAYFMKCNASCFFVSTYNNLHTAKTSTESCFITLNLFHLTTCSGTMHIVECYVMFLRGKIKKEMAKLKNNKLLHYCFFKKVSYHSYINKIFFKHTFRIRRILGYW